MGFYYSANAGGRLLGTLLSGISYQAFGLTGVILVALGMLVIATVFMMQLRSSFNYENTNQM